MTFFTCTFVLLEFNPIMMRLCPRCLLVVVIHTEPTWRDGKLTGYSNIRMLVRFADIKHLTEIHGHEDPNSEMQSWKVTTSRNCLDRHLQKNVAQEILRQERPPLPS